MTLADAIIYGDKASVVSLLNSGVDPNELDEYGYTPLIESAIVNRPDIAELLLRHGATVNMEDSVGGSAFHWATDNNNLDFCKLLLAYRANPNVYNAGGQSPLVFPLLRGQNELKEFLYQAGADLNFAQDFINAKLIGHRFELKGEVDIVDHDKNFIALDFEGFFLEFTISIIQDSLQRFRRNFAARHLSRYFRQVKTLLSVFSIAAQLIKFQQYMVNIKEHEQEINRLLDSDLLIIPIAHRGHAIAYVKFGTLFARCDRGEESHYSESVVVFRITKPEAMNKSFLKQLLYVRNSPEFMKEGVKEILGLEPVTHLSIDSQITGNCSWANIEATIPTLLFMLMMKEEPNSDIGNIIKCKNTAMEFYKQWREWDKDRALEDCVARFQLAKAERRASMATILANVLVQRCEADNPLDLKRAEKILSILNLPEYHYILKSYTKVLIQETHSELGEKLQTLLETCQEEFNLDLSEFL